MHKAWPKLLKRIESGDPPTNEDHELVVASRIWFCLFLFEHQSVGSLLCSSPAHLSPSRMSYGTGRPAVMKDDESIRECHRLVQHPLAIEDDTRLVSTVELMAIREKIQNVLAPYDKPVHNLTFEVLAQAEKDLNSWYQRWDTVLSQKYEDGGQYT
jgi:hypothetical protein